MKTDAPFTIVHGDTVLGHFDKAHQVHHLLHLERGLMTDLPVNALLEVREKDQPTKQATIQSYRLEGKYGRWFKVSGMAVEVL
jgi:hypothetical protein